MSIGFHYFETINGSLTLQWIDKDKTAEFLGRVIATRSAASIIAFSFVWVSLSAFSAMELYVALHDWAVALLFCHRFILLAKSFLAYSQKR